MKTPDTCRTFVPYFKIHAGKLDEARARRIADRRGRSVAAASPPPEATLPGDGDIALQRKIALESGGSHGATA
jgi:hypothetical protein